MQYVLLIVFTVSRVRVRTRGMFLHVGRQIAAVIELLAANLTLKRLNPGMYPLVYRQVTTVPKLFTAHVTFVGLHARVSSQVSGEISTVAEHLSTYLAAVRTLAGMRSHVYSQVATVRKTLVTLAALVRPLPVVRSHVYEQIALVSELLEANLTLAFQLFTRARLRGALRRSPKAIVFHGGHRLRRQRLTNIPYILQILRQLRLLVLLHYDGVACTLITLITRLHLIVAVLLLDRIEYAILYVRQTSSLFRLEHGLLSVNLALRRHLARQLRLLPKLRQLTAVLVLDILIDKRIQGTV